ARARKSLRSNSASRAISARRALRRLSISPSLLQVDFELGSHPLAEEHRVVAFHDPFRPAMGDRLDSFVLFHLVEHAVARQLEHDHVVEVPAVCDVVPADEPDAVFLAVLADLPREQRLHVELEERVAAAADGEVGREHGHGALGPPSDGSFGAEGILARRARSPGPRRSRSQLPVGPSPFGSSALASSSISPTVFVCDRSGRRRASARRSAATRRSRKMIVWPTNSSSTSVVAIRTIVIGTGHSHAALRGVRTTTIASTTTWSQKQPNPGPFSASRGARVDATGRLPGGTDCGGGWVTSEDCSRSRGISSPGRVEAGWVPALPESPE